MEGTDIVAVETGGCSAVTSLRGCSDPNIFRNERVLRMLLKREIRHSLTSHQPLASKTSHSSLQTELRPSMRRELASWMLEVCEEEAACPQVFCLAVTYLDRFLQNCKIAKSQLQLLGAVCLLVSWKVREHSPITAQRLIEYTDFNISLDDLLEWEFLLLSKLDWDLSLVIAPDFVEHILQRLLRLDLAWNTEVTRSKALTLIHLAYSLPSLACLAPSLLALASVLTSLRPGLESSSDLLLLRDTPSPSSTSSLDSPSSKVISLSPMDRVMSVLGRVTMADKAMVLETVSRLETLMEDALPPSPAVSDEDKSPPASSSSRIISSSPLTSRKLFKGSIDKQSDSGNNSPSENICIVSEN